MRMTLVMEQRQWLKGPGYYLAPVVFSAALFHMSPMLVPLLALAAVPLYWAMATHGRAYGLTVAFGAAMASLIVSGMEWALAYTAICVMLALAAAEAFLRSARLGAAVALGAALPFAASLGLAVLMSFGSGGLWKTTSEMAEKVTQMALARQVPGHSEKSVEAVGPEEEARKALSWVLASAFPGLLFSVSLLFSLLHYLAARGLSIKYSWGIHDQGHDLANWRAPSWLVLTFGAGLGLSFLGPYNVLAAAGLNIVFGAGMVLALHGLSLLHYWMEKAKLAAPLKGLIFALALIANAWAAISLCLLGLADIMADFRRSGGGGGAGV